MLSTASRAVQLCKLTHKIPGISHFRKALEIHRTRPDAFYGMAGAAKWCLGQPKDAVAEWHNGLKARYADAGGLGVKMPLLLFFTATVKPEAFEHVSAKELMSKKTNDPRIRIWPGPIASWLLGQITEEAFQNQCKSMDTIRASDCQWFATFYRSIHRYDSNKKLEFKETMRKLTDMSQAEWADQNYFLNRMWSEEFFLARHEAQRPN